MRGYANEDSDRNTNAEKPESPEGRFNKGRGDLPAVRSPTEGADLKPGEGRPTTSEDAEKIRQAQEEWAKNPKRLTHYAFWEEVSEP